MADSSKKIQDEDRLAEMGYKQELRRDWSMLHNFGVSFSIIVGGMDFFLHVITQLATYGRCLILYRYVASRMQCCMEVVDRMLTQNDLECNYWYYNVGLQRGRLTEMLTSSALKTFRIWLDNRRAWCHVRWLDCCQLLQFVPAFRPCEMLSH